MTQSRMQTQTIDRRTALRLLGGAVGSALLWGCGGGGGGTPKRTVRGIILEDDGNGNVTPAGAGKTIHALRFDPLIINQLESTTATDAQGKFALSLTTGQRYKLLTNAYPYFANDPPSLFIGSCADATGFVLPASGSLTEVVYAGSSAGTGSVVRDAFAQRAGQLLSQYQASGIYSDLDVLILADLPCVGTAPAPITTNQLTNPLVG